MHAGVAARRDGVGASVIVPSSLTKGGPSLQSRPGLLKVASCHAARPTERGFKKYINVV
jgi:hypothetical protein